VAVKPGSVEKGGPYPLLVFHAVNHARGQGGKRREGVKRMFLLNDLYSSSLNTPERRREGKKKKETDLFVAFLLDRDRGEENSFSSALFSRKKRGGEEKNDRLDHV